MPSAAPTSQASPPAKKGSLGWKEYGLIGGLVLVAGLGYFLIKKQKGGSPGSSSQGGPVIVAQGPGMDPLALATYLHDHHGSGGSAKPPGNTRGITVTRDETFGQFAASRHWDAATIAAAENDNIVQGGGKLTKNTMLHKGQVIVRPVK